MIRRTAAIAFAVFGLFLIAGAVGLTLWNFRTDINAGKENEEILERMVEAIGASAVRDSENGEGENGEEDTGSDFLPGLYTPEAMQEPEQGETITTYIYTPEEGLQSVVREPQTVVIDGREYIGVLSIPSLALELPILKECDDKTVDKSPGCWAGNPNENGFVIGGHNYIRHLGRIDRLKPGDKIIFMDLESHVYKYKVVGQVILGADEGKELCDEEWALSLFTCTLVGNRRIVVRCLKDDSK